MIGSTSLTQAEADVLIAMVKIFADREPVIDPAWDR
jgi:hypothetical protein